MNPCELVNLLGKLSSHGSLISSITPPISTHPYNFEQILVIVYKYFSMSLKDKDS